MSHATPPASTVQRPAPSPPRPRPSLGARRFGYSVAITVNLVLWYLVNRSPGWDAVPFLSPETTQVVGWVNASLLLAVVANLLYAMHDPPWLKPLGDALTTAFGVVVMVRFWQVFPFTEDVTATWWSDLVRVVLVVGIIGSVIGVVTGVVRCAQALTRR